MQEITPRSLLVSAKGGQLDFVSPDGELLMSVAVPPGIVSAREFFEIAPEGCEVQVSDGIAVRQPRAGYGFQSSDRHAESGANPDFQPTHADRLQRQMRLQLAHMQAQQKTLDAKVRALTSIERVPQAPAVAPDPAAQALPDTGENPVVE